MLSAAQVGSGGLSYIPEIPVFAQTLLSGQPLGLEEQLKVALSQGWYMGKSLAALVWGKGPQGIGWELLTRLFDSSKGRKPTLILRTQLSVRVNAILGECVRTSVSGNHPSPAGSVSFRPLLDRGQGRTETGYAAPPHSYPELSFQGQG